jgi:hypothetical protein
VAAWGLGRAGSSLLFGVAPGDVGTLASVSAIAAAVIVAACALPARRAAAITPMAAWRQPLT